MQKQTRVGFENVKTCQFHMFYDPITMSAGPEKDQGEKSKSRDLMRRCIISGVAVSTVLLCVVACGRCCGLKTAPVRATGSGKFHGKIQRSWLVHHGAHWMSSRCPSVESVLSKRSIVGHVLRNSRSCSSHLAVQWSPIASRRGRNVGQLVDPGFLFLDPLLSHDPHS